MQHATPTLPATLAKLALLALTTASLLCAPVQAQEPQQQQAYLYELLDKPGYARAWQQLLKAERGLDPWLARYARTRMGPTAPEDELVLEGQRYAAHMVCKAHDCGAQRFFVVFSPDASRAWGLLLSSGKAERFLGQPDAAMQNALRRLAGN